MLSARRILSARRRPRSGWATILGLGPILAVFLAGCGFEPLYGGGGGGSKPMDEALAQITVAPIPERLGQRLANNLRDDFDRYSSDVAKRYVLAVTVRSNFVDSAIRQDGTASRRSFEARASFILRDLKTNEQVFSGNARFNTSFDVGQNEYSVVIAQNDAEARSAEDMSEQIRTQVSLYMHRRAGNEARM